MTHIRVHARRVTAVLLIWMAIIAARTIQIQVRDHTTYTQLAQRQARLTMCPYPERAEIYDRHGTPLVQNTERTAICIAPRSCHDNEHVRAYLAYNFPDRVAAFDAHPDAYFMYVRRHPSDRELAAITDDPIPEIFTVTEDDRSPSYAACRDVIGHTDSDTHGISGLEYLFDAQLRGTPGIHHLYRDARTRDLHFHKYVQQSYQPGMPLHTTLDATLTFLVHQCVEEHRHKHQADLTSALILDPQQGDVHAIAQSAHNYHESLMPITQTYELGSVMKAFTVTAALEEQVTTPDEWIWCENTTRTHLNNMPVTTWQSNGWLTCADVIRMSNNIGTAKLALRLGTSLYQQFSQFGIGEATHIAFPGEPSGHMTRPRQWSRASPISLSFGYEVRLSLLQLARAFSLFATDGHLVQPRLLNPETPGDWSNKRVQSETVHQVRDILAIDTMKSTSHRGYIPGYHIYGKTGSAHLISHGTYDHSRGIYTFAGLVEKDDYQRIIVTCVREPQGNNIYAATVAVPLFKRIAQKMIMHDKQIKD